MELYRFTASWCAPCKVLEKTLSKMNLPYGIKVVDIDTDSDMAQKFKIRSVPTMILTKDDVETSRLVGLKTEKEINEWISQNG